MTPGRKSGYAASAIHDSFVLIAGMPSRSSEIHAVSSVMRSEGWCPGRESIPHGLAASGF